MKNSNKKKSFTFLGLFSRVTSLIFMLGICIANLNAKDLFNDLCVLNVMQQHSVKGRVIDQNGSPLPGVTIVIKGTSTGTVSSEDGDFIFSNIPENTTLVFSFVGMKTEEVNIAGRNMLTVIMKEESIGMEELVVVGYGVQKKTNLTGAVAAVKMDETITSRSIPNVSSMLQGLIPGLSVNQNSGMAGNNSSELLVRGLGTVNNARPLVVVDGLPDVDINRINMNDIESISVLKDASKKFEPEWILISRPLLKYNRYSIKKQIGIYNIHYLKWLIVKIQIKTWEII